MKNFKALLVMLCCLVLSGCGSIRSLLYVPPAKPQAALVEPCADAVPYPETRATLRVWKPILEANAAALADCAARHRELAEWAIKVTK